MLKLEFPNESHRRSMESLRQIWWEPTSPARLFAGADFDEFLTIVSNDLSAKTTPAERVPGHLFLLVDGTRAHTDNILWGIQIRHHIDHPDYQEVGGHIGYGVRPDERGKGYATEMLRMALIKAKELGLKKVLLTCGDANTASWKTIEANGGVFERTTLTQEGRVSRRYWIHLDDECSTESTKNPSEEGNTLVR